MLLLQTCCRLLLLWDSGDGTAVYSAAAASACLRLLTKKTDFVSAACVHFVQKKKNRCGLDTGARHFSVRFGTASMPVLDTLVSSVHALKYTPGNRIPFATILGVPVFVRHGLSILRNTPAWFTPVWFGTKSTTPPDSSVTSLRTRYRYPTLR